MSHGTDLELLTGKTLPLFTNPEITAQDLLKHGAQKMQTFNKDLMEGPYVLLYSDCTEAINVAGIERPFPSSDCKKEIGKSYNGISLVIFKESQYNGGLLILDFDGHYPYLYTQQLVMVK